MNNYTCDCTDTGYEGIHCEHNINDCKGNPCQNGALCIDEVKDYQCKCYSGYTGKYLFGNKFKLFLIIIIIEVWMFCA